LIAFAVHRALIIAAMGIFLIVRCATQRQREAKKVTTQFRIARAHGAMTPGAPSPLTLPGRSPIVVTLPAAAVATAQRDVKSAAVPDVPDADAQA